MERAKGFEPSAQNSEVTQPQAPANSSEEGYTQIRAQILNSADSDLQKVAVAWSSLSQPIKAAILAIVDSTAAAEVKR